MTHLTDPLVFCPSYQYGKRRLYRTDVAQAASGRTERNSLWEYGMHVFSMPLINRLQTELDELAEYFHACRWSRKYL